MSGIGLAILLNLLITSAPDGKDRVDRARVVVDALDVFDHPDRSAYATTQLELGDEVLVHSEEPGGWLAIEPPDLEFLWVDRADLNIQPNGLSQVGSHPAEARSARDGARMPGPPDLVLEAGAAVRLVERPSLTLQQGHGRRVWCAIEPPEGVQRYIRADGVRFSSVRTRIRQSSQRSDLQARIGSELVAVGSAPPEGSLSTSDAVLFRQLDAEHRAILRQPLDFWQLERVRRGYENILDRATDPMARSALQGRLGQTGRQVAAAEAARRFTDLVRRSQLLDRHVETPIPASAAKSSDRDEPFDVSGLLMRSSKQIDGDPVWALVGPDGLTRAYLLLPPGIAVEKHVGKQVGVRGMPRYDATLRAEVFSVQELEPLGGAP